MNRKPRVAEIPFDSLKDLLGKKKPEVKKKPSAAKTSTIQLAPSALSSIVDVVTVSPMAGYGAGGSSSNPPAFINTMDMDIPPALSERMFDHQKEGIDWLASLHSNFPGGILGDDMGMGKTFTVTAFLTSLLRTHSIRKVLILCPVSVLESWNREICNHCLPNVHKCYAHLISSEVSKAKRESILEQILCSNSATRKHVCVASYTLMSNSIDSFAREE